MDYGVWNLPSGFWQTSNPMSISNDNLTRATFITAPSNGIPVYHSSLNENEIANYAIVGSQSYRHQTELLSSKNVLGRQTSIVDDKPSLDGISLSSELTEHMEQSNDSAQQSCTSVPVIAVRPRIKLKSEPTNFEPPDNSNGQPAEEYMAQQSFQHPMYGMLLSQMNVCKDDASVSEGDDDIHEKMLSTGTPSLDSAFGETAEAAPCRSPANAETTGSGFECGECGFVTEERHSLKKHFAAAHPEQSNEDLGKSMSVRNICPMPSCRFRTNERNEMEAHVARHVAEGFAPNNKKSKPCSIALQRVRYEREEYRCQMCAYSCTIEKAFYKHLKNHTVGISPAPIKISCSICGKDRTSEVDMSKHMKKHRDDRYFCCDICIFKTVQLKKLIQHRRMHTGEKPHLCPHCSYRSARRDNLRSHVRRVHKKENLYCDTFNPRGLLLSASAGATSAPAPNTTQQEIKSAPSCVVGSEEVKSML